MITDERTLAAWLSGPTEARARQLQAEGREPIVLFADVEEHVVDPSTGLTKRCDLTLRGASGPVVTAEMKRPEVSDAASPELLRDAWSKAVARGLPYFITCNFAKALVWDTTHGPDQHTPVSVVSLADGMSDSKYAPARRDEIARNWVSLLDKVENLLRLRLAVITKKPSLPPRAQELKRAILKVADEASERVRRAAENDAFRLRTLDLFRAQFGVEMTLDPRGNTTALS